MQKLLRSEHTKNDTKRIIAAFFNTTYWLIWCDDSDRHITFYCLKPKAEKFLVDTVWCAKVFVYVAPLAISFFNSILVAICDVIRFHSIYRQSRSQFHFEHKLSAVKCNQITIHQKFNMRITINNFI